MLPVSANYKRQWSVMRSKSCDVSFHTPTESRPYMQVDKETRVSYVYDSALNLRGQFGTIQARSMIFRSINNAASRLLIACSQNSIENVLNQFVRLMNNLIQNNYGSNMTLTTQPDTPTKEIKIHKTCTHNSLQTIGAIP